jgi:hypothetical protein
MIQCKSMRTLIYAFNSSSILRIWSLCIFSTMVAHNYTCTKIWYVSIYPCTCMHCIFVCAYMFFMYACMHAHMCVYAFVCTSMYEGMCVCIEKHFITHTYFQVLRMYTYRFCLGMHHVYRFSLGVHTFNRYDDIFAPTSRGLTRSFPKV